MTWNQLAKKIAEMPPAARRQKVQAMEPYSWGSVYTFDTLWRANEEAARVTTAKKDHYYLAE